MNAIANLFKTIILIASLLCIAIFSTAQTAKPMITNNDTLITGKIILSELEQFQWYADGYRSFAPDAAKVKEIQKARDRDMKLMIFGGSWCEDTQKLLPGFMKILAEAKWPASQIEIHFLDRDKKLPNEIEKTHNIRYVPTFILTKGNVELGRVVERFTIGAESDLLLIMNMK